MKGKLLGLMLMALLLLMAGCGGGHDEVLISPPPVPPPASQTTQILSDPDVDGDIQQVGVTRTVSIVGRDNLTSILAGIDPGTGDEYRAFLDFPLTSVPLNANIELATLSLFISSVIPPSTIIPLRIELVSFNPVLIPPLVASYFDRAILVPLTATPVIFPISSTLAGDVNIDVTPLMVQAQTSGLLDFQVRILEDFGIVTPGLVEIDESSDAVAPQLTVVYN